MKAYLLYKTNDSSAPASNLGKNKQSAIDALNSRMDGDYEMFRNCIRVSKNVVKDLDSGERFNLAKFELPDVWAVRCADF